MVKYSENQKEKMVEWTRNNINNPDEFDPQTVDWQEEIFTDKERIEEVWTFFKEYIKERYEVIEGYEEDEYLHYMREGREKRESQVLESIDEAPAIDVEKGMEEIEDYTYRGKEYTYSALISLINDTSVINDGQPGSGKSRSSKDLVNMLDIPKVVVHVGYMTAKRFYSFVEANKDCIIVLDEADMLLKNRDIQQMIKTMLSNQMLSWKTDKRDLETEFDGSLIVNCNKGKFDKCITDKVLTNEKGFSTEDFKAKIKQARNYEPDMEMWDKIRERIVYTRHNPLELTEKQKDLIYDFIDELNYIGSFRDKQRIFGIFRAMKNLFGTLNEDVMGEAKQLAEESLGGSKLDKVIAKEPKQKPLERKELKEKVANALGISTRQANNKIRDLIDSNKLKKGGKRGVVLKP